MRGVASILLRSMFRNSGDGGPRHRPVRSTPRRRRPLAERLEGRTLLSGAHEVWTLDQSNTKDADGDGSLESGGFLHVHRGRQLAGRNASRAAPETIDLGGLIDIPGLVPADPVTGTVQPPTRPHMSFFNADQTVAAIAFVASGHILFMDAGTRTPIEVIDVGAQAHAAVPSPDQTYVLVANQNGKLLQRINTDADGDGKPYEGRGENGGVPDIVLDNAATLNLAALEDAGQPDNAPITPIIDSSSRLTFVTLRGGGLFVVDASAPKTPMALVAEYDRDHIMGDGFGGIEIRGKMYINSGGHAHGGSNLFVFRLADFATPPGGINTPEPMKHLAYPDPEVAPDWHGMVLARKGRYLWMAGRASNDLTIVDTRRDIVIKRINLVGALSDDPTPDILGISPDGKRIYVSLRGPNPLSGTPHIAVGSTPGVGVIRVARGGRGGVFQVIAPITNKDAAGVERADPHGIAVRVLRRQPRRNLSPARLDTTPRLDRRALRILAASATKGAVGRV